MLCARHDDAADAAVLRQAARAGGFRRHSREELGGLFSIAYVRASFAKSRQSVQLLA